MSNNISQANSAFYLVTGAAGFVGSHLIESLVNAGNNVIAVDNLASGTINNLASVINHPNLTFYEKDIRQKGFLSELINIHKEISCVFHLAAMVSVPYSLKYPEEARAINCDAALNLYHDTIKADIEKFIFAGSAAEYGDTALPAVNENFTAVPISSYGEQKLRVTETILKKNWGVSLRFFNIYGPGQDSENPYCGVITRFIDSALRGQALTIKGDGKQTRDFIYINDAIQAYIIAAGLHNNECNDVSGVYNVGSGNEISINELAKIIKKLTNNNIEFKYTPAIKGDIRRSCADISKIKSLGFTPGTSFEDGLQETLKIYNSSMKIEKTNKARFTCYHLT